MSDDFWKDIPATRIAGFARAWLAVLRGDVQDEENKVGQWVVFMNFTAPPEVQWSFIVSAVAQASSDAELGHIAAGPMEHLLGWHGPAFIDRIEAQAASDHKFARALTGVLKYKIEESIWTRVQALRAAVPSPLVTGDSDGRS